MCHFLIRLTKILALETIGNVHDESLEEIGFNEISNRFMNDLPILASPERTMKMVMVIKRPTSSQFHATRWIPRCSSPWLVPLLELELELASTVEAARPTKNTITQPLIVDFLQIF